MLHEASLPISADDIAQQQFILIHNSIDLFVIDQIGLVAQH